MNNIFSRRLDVKHNVTFNVYDEATGKLVSHHEGHNASTNSLLTGIGHYLAGDGIFNQGTDLLSLYVPRYISVGTMGLYSQEEDAEGLPAGQQTNIDIDVAATFGTDAALFPLHFDYLKFFLSSATAKTRQRFAMNGIWLLCDKYIDTNDDLPTTRVPDASGVQKCLTADGVVIIRNNRKYSVMGVAIK